MTSKLCKNKTNQNESRKKKHQRLYRQYFQCLTNKKDWNGIYKFPCL